MTIPSFSERRKAWSSPPVDDIGYFPAQEMLTWDDETLNDVLGKMAESRYGGWRNFQMRWRTVLGLDTTRGKDVLDYGCGVGLEALQYAKMGNRVYVADITEYNIMLAKRTLEASGYRAERSFRIHEAPPFIFDAHHAQFDVIHCCGVLHHIPNPVPVVSHMAHWLVHNGELRLMVYSDEAWRIATKTEPPESVADSELFERYWTHWDPIGGYADWYDQKRLEERFGAWFDVKECEYLTKHGEYLGAVLVKR
jgi:SAM-dependent methyltransferase